MSQFVLLKVLHFVKVINAIIEFSLQKSKQSHERYRSKVSSSPGEVDAYGG